MSRDELSIKDAVVAAWSGELGTAQVDGADNFFRLGGHSLSAAKVSQDMARALGHAVKVRLLFENPTLDGYVAVLAAIVDDHS